MTDPHGFSGMPNTGPLRGASVFLSASTPSPERSELYRRIPHAQVEVEDAVVALARAVFAHGGRLVLGGHPSISPLVAMVAGEYRDLTALEHARDDAKQPLVVIHQLDVYRSALPDATVRMAEWGLAEITWHETLPDEQRTWSRASSAYPRSMAAMRERMIAHPSIAGMVCIGGMEGIEAEYELMRSARPSMPIFVLRRTGGACDIIARRVDSSVRDSGEVRVIDDELLADLRLRLRRAEGEFVDAPLRYTPYPFIMTEVVNRIVRSR